METTNFPNGLTSFGVPLLGSFNGVGAPFRDGNYWFVDQATGSDSTSGGTSIDSAFATITKALSVAQAGDTIVIAPATYAENLSVTTDYISMIGWSPSGYARPDIVPTTGVALSVTANGFVANHLRFASSDNSDSVGQHGNGFLYNDCVFDGNALQSSKANLRLVGNTTDNTASEGKILNSYIRGGGAAGIVIQHKLAATGGEGTTDNEIAGCRFVDNVTSDLLSAVNTNGGGAGIYINLSVHDNQFMTSGASYKYINFAAGAAGDLTANSCLISNNFFADEALTGGTGNQIDLGGQSKAHFAGNYSDASVVNGTTFNN